MKDPNDLYLAVLQSNTVADGLIKRLNLMDRLQGQEADQMRGGCSLVVQSSSAKKARYDQHHRSRTVIAFGPRKSPTPT